MNEATWIIIVGLVFDIAGAILIVSPLLNYVKRRKIKDGDYEAIDYEELPYARPDPRREWYAQLKARIGVGLLSFGFLLQIIGNWLQNTPI